MRGGGVPAIGVEPRSEATNSAGMHTPMGRAQAKAPSSPTTHYVAPVQKSRGNNSLMLVPPGFKQRVELPFPDRCLPVCVRCKKNYKTRELCRSRDGHTDLPWSTTYVCVTLDPSCIDEKGRLIDGPFVSKSLEPQSYCAKGAVASSTPICAPCKEKNYTRSYCREKQQHRQLPWSTVYVRLSAENPNFDHQERRNDVQGSNGAQQHVDSPSNGMNSPNSPGSTRKREEEVDGRDPKKRKVDTVLSLMPSSLEAEETPVQSPNAEETVPSSPKAVGESIDGSKNDDIFPVPDSRTFILKVCDLGDKSCVMHWVDVDKSARPRSTRREEVRQDPSPASPNPNYGHYPPAAHYHPYHPPQYGSHYQHPPNTQWYSYEPSHHYEQPYHYDHPAKQEYYPPDERYPEYPPVEQPGDAQNYDRDHYACPPPPPPPQHSYPPWHGYHPPPPPGPDSYPPVTESSDHAPNNSGGEHAYHPGHMPLPPPDFCPELQQSSIS